MSWLFGLPEADRGSKPAPNPPPLPAATDAESAVNRWEQDYLRSAGALDLAWDDDIETGHPRNGQRAVSGGGVEAAAYYRQHSSADRPPSNGAPLKPGPTLAELARSVSDASIYYAQRQPPRPLPTAPEASPWVDTDGAALLSMRCGDGAPTQAPPGDLPSTSGTFSVRGTRQSYSVRTCHGVRVRSLHVSASVK